MPQTGYNGLIDFNQLINTNMNSFFYSIELTYYSTSCLCKAIANRSNFNVVSTNYSDAHVYELVCSPNDGSKNELNYYLFTPFAITPFCMSL